MDTDSKSRLLQLLLDRAFLRQNVVLSSGEKSDYYIDGKMVEVTPEGAHLIGEVIYEHIADREFDAIGGLAVGAVPLVTSAVISCFHHGMTIEGFWVREEAKSHGTKKLVEGKLPENANVVIVDDVITSGRSVLKAIEVVEAKGAIVSLVLAIVDRQRGARELFEEKGYLYEPVFTKEDLFAHAGTA